MTRTLNTAIVIAFVTALAAPAFAQDTAIDINADGMYSYAELQAVMPEMSEDTFSILDVSGDGLLDATEIEAGTAAGLL